MRISGFTLLLLLFLTVTAWAENFSIDLNNHSAQIGYTHQLNLNTQDYGETLIRARYLYNDDTDTNLFGVNGGVVGTPGNIAGLSLGVDIGLNGGETRHNKELLAIGLGFNAEYAPPQLRGFGIDAHMLYAPDILSFMDSKDYLELGLGVNYRILPNAKVTLAYQKINVDIKDRGDRDLDDTVRLGIQFQF